MRAHVNRGAPPGYPSAALRDRWKFCGCAGDHKDGNWLAPCAVARPMISSTSLAETLPLPYFSLRVSIKGFFTSDPARLSATAKNWSCFGPRPRRGACASAILLRTPPLGDMMKMQVHTGQTRVANSKARTRASQKVTLRLSVPWTWVTVA